MKNAMQLKSIVRNMSKETNVSAQLILQNYMLEHLLARISASQYRGNCILKGGFLIASIVGLDTRATMDMDVSITGRPVTEDAIATMFGEIISIPIDDDISFAFNGINEIREGDDYNGFRVHLSGNFPPLSVPMKLDITTGDAITPKEIRYEHITMLEHRSIPVLAYNIETILSEKIETILSRGDQTTRPRDYYDVYILWKLRRANINLAQLTMALAATTKHRGSSTIIRDYRRIIGVVRSSDFMREQWRRYQRAFAYAQGISFDETCNAVMDMMESLSP